MFIYDVYQLDEAKRRNQSDVQRALLVKQLNEQKGKQKSTVRLLIELSASTLNYFLFKFDWSPPRMNFGHE